MEKRCGIWLVLVLVFFLGGCGDSGSTIVASVGGNAFPFNEGPDARMEGARVWILEHPEMSVLTDKEGYFQFDGLSVGSDATLRLEKDGTNFFDTCHLIQTGTLSVGPEGAERVSFQAVTNLNYYMLALSILSWPDDKNTCQMVTTVTRVGKSIYDPGAHGEAGATVTLDPPLPPENGPIYFNSDVMPDKSLTETSDDGGVLFVNVPPGEYVWTANKAGVSFRQVRMKCEAGWLVNASPPWGLQAQ